MAACLRFVPALGGLLISILVAEKEPKRVQVVPSAKAPIRPV